MNDDRPIYPDEDPCHECHGEGFVMVCIDDLCVGTGQCMHGDGEVVCPVCKGEGAVAIPDRVARYEPAP